MIHISNPYRRTLELCALLLLATLAAPALAEHDRAGVTLFQHVYFEGRNETFYGDVPDLRSTYVGNDATSSIAVDRGCRATLYADAYFRGSSVTVHHDLPDLRGTYVDNDRVSSLRVECRSGYGGKPGYYDGPRRGGVTVFADSGFRGRSETFLYDDPDLRDNAIRQDSISSVAVDRGCRVVLYADVGFRGAATVLTGDHDDLRFSEVGNDRVSSIQVDCRRR